MQRPGFWDDQEAAARTSAAHARAQRKLKTFRELEAEVGDLGELAEMASEDEEMAAELTSQLASVERRLAELEEARLFSGEYDSGDAVVTVHAGAGGTDSQDWAEILLRMYLRWAERRGFEVEMKEASPGEEAGLKSATFIARGENAYGLFAAERGVHRLVRISPFDSSSRRHTSFAQVDVGPLVDEGVEVEIDDADLRVDTYRASGAGGQHVNKTDSAVRITHIPTGVVVQCQNERSQTQNKAVAMQLLRSKLIELEERKRAEELAKARGEVKDVAWGSQIRSYVLHPYTMVKDHRTDHEVGDVQRVLDGDIDEFVRDYLNRTAASSSGLACAGERRPAGPKDAYAMALGWAGGRMVPRFEFFFSCFFLFFSVLRVLRLLPLRLLPLLLRLQSRPREPWEWWPHRRRAGPAILTAPASRATRAISATAVRLHRLAQRTRLPPSGIPDLDRRECLGALADALEPQQSFLHRQAAAVAAERPRRCAGRGDRGPRSGSGWSRRPCRRRAPPARCRRSLAISV